MGSANLTTEQIQMRYPPSIIAWEMKHGFVRYEKDGMLYISCARPYEEICESIRKESIQLAEMTKKRKRGEIV